MRPRSQQRRATWRSCSGTSANREPGPMPAHGARRAILDALNRRAPPRRADPARHRGWTARSVVSTVMCVPPSRPLAEHRADLAELASVLRVWRDLVEWRGSAIGSDPRAAELVRQRDDIAARITGSVIANRAPGDP